MAAVFPQRTPFRPLLAAALFVLVFALRAGPTGAAEDAVPVRNGMPLEATIAPGSSAWVGRIDIPPEAVALSVIVSADRDVDLHLRFERPATLDYAETADASSLSPSPYEVLALGPGQTPALKPGAWFITVENPFPQSGGVSFEIAAFVDRRGADRSVLPGEPATVGPSPSGRGVLLRTYVPRRALRAEMDLAPPASEGLRFRVEGPNGFSRQGTSRQGRLVIDRSEAPPGTYLLNVAPEGDQRGAHFEARMTLVFPGGWVLPQPPSAELKPGTPMPFLLGGEQNGDSQRFRVVVPTGWRGFVLEAANARGLDADIYVRRGQPPQHEDEDADWVGLSTAPVEHVVVGGTDPLEPGLYHGEVVLLENENPAEVVVTLKPIEGATGPHAWGDEDPPVLLPDAWTPGAVEVGRSGIQWFGVDLPEGTGALHAQVLDASGPLELVLARPSDGSITARAFSAMVDEHLGVAFNPPLQAVKRMYLGVVNRATWESRVTFRIAVGIDRRPTLPSDLVWPPVMKTDDLTVPEKTAAATVEITIGDCSGGSGVCVSPSGLVLSCRHCLEMTDGSGRVQRDPILVAFTRTFDIPPIQTFFAEIVEEDQDKDLVLLRPLRDVFGRPLPSDVAFPWVPLGDSEKARLGQTLFVAGYPQMGSECVRTAVVLSRGIVSGLERETDGTTWIKTDAWVAPGHSGGPVVDEEGRLLALAAATLGTTESLGLAIPVARFPKSFLERIRAVQ